MGDRGSVAVLGAGMAGAVTARRLAQAGFAVSVYDKGRGIGGRMATRRGADGTTFDHGAQFLTARGPAFGTCLADWRARGIVAKWGEPGRDVGLPSMTAPVHDLLTGLDVHSGCTVTGLARDSGGWTLAVTEEPVDRRFDVVVVSFPAPQTASLLSKSGLSLEYPALRGLDRPAYAPCWTLMLASADQLPIAGGELRDSAGPIAQVFREDSKPGRAQDGTRLVIHATPDWSRAHLEESREAVAAALIDALAQALGTQVTPSQARAHRWRYALVETALGRPCVYEPALHLGACGDWCLGPGIEDAFDSGTALAALIAADVA